MNILELKGSTSTPTPKASSLTYKRLAMRIRMYGAPLLSFEPAGMCYDDVLDKELARHTMQE
jgi:hypothetical protein